NAAGEGPLPRPAAQALARATLEKERPESLGRAQYFDLPAALRERIARLIGASTEEIALTGSTSTGIGIAARELPLPPGGEVLLLEGQFPANVLPWSVAKRRGAVVKRGPLRRGESPLQAVRNAAGPRTAVVAIDWVGFASGVKAEIVEVADLCRRLGAIFVLDGAQGVGALSIDVKAAGIDVLACPGHKWLLGPPGTGFLYVSKRWLDLIHPYNAGWMNLAEKHGFRNLLSIPKEPPADATRLEAGTPSYVLFPAWLESLDLLLSLGAARIERRLMALAEAAREAALRA